MTKKVWEMPLAVIEGFAPNEYIAACGDSGTTYLFECNAPQGTLYYYPKSDGTIDGQHDANDEARRLGNYHPCGEKHSASSTSDFYDGFIDMNYNGKYDSGDYAVIVWRGPWGNNGHATTKLNMSTWETTKS